MIVASGSEATIWKVTGSPTRGCSGEKVTTTVSGRVGPGSAHPRRRRVRPRANTRSRTSRSVDGKAHLLQAVTQPAAERHQSPVEMRLHGSLRQPQDICDL